MHPIFQSKRFWSALIGLLTVVLVGFFPELEDNMDMIQETALVLFGSLIGGYSIQDAVSAARKPAQDTGTGEYTKIEKAFYAGKQKGYHEARNEAVTGDSAQLVGNEVENEESANIPPDAQKPRSKIKM